MSNEPTLERSNLDTGATKMLAMQSLFVLVITGFFYAYQGPLAAQSALYGGSIVMLNVWMMNRRVQAAIELAKVAPGTEVRILYLAAIQRFILTLILLGLGMGGLQLPPLPMVVSFAIAQFGYLFTGRFHVPKH